MTIFDIEAAEQARIENPSLTVLDTGEMLSPQLHYKGTDSYGAVDFDDDGGSTACTVYAHPSSIDDDTTVIEIDTLAPGRFKIVLNDGILYNGHPEIDSDPATTLRNTLAPLAAALSDALDSRTLEVRETGKPVRYPVQDAARELLAAIVAVSA